MRRLCNTVDLIATISTVINTVALSGVWYASPRRKAFKFVVHTGYALGFVCIVTDATIVFTIASERPRNATVIRTLHEVGFVASFDAAQWFVRSVNAVIFTVAEKLFRYTQLLSYAQKFGLTASGLAVCLVRAVRTVGHMVAFEAYADALGLISTKEFAFFAFQWSALVSSALERTFDASACLAVDVCNGAWRIRLTIVLTWTVCLSHTVSIIVFDHSFWTVATFDEVGITFIIEIFTLSITSVLACWTAWSVHLWRRTHSWAQIEGSPVHANVVSGAFSGKGCDRRTQTVAITSGVASACIVNAISVVSVGI